MGFPEHIQQFIHKHNALHYRSIFTNSNFSDGWNTPCSKHRRSQLLRASKRVLLTTKEKKTGISGYDTGCFKRIDLLLKSLSLSTDLQADLGKDNIFFKSPLRLKKKKLKHWEIDEQSVCHNYCNVSFEYLAEVPAGSPSRGGNVVVSVQDVNQLSLPTSFFLFCSCAYFCLCGPFNCISFHNFSR